MLQDEKSERQRSERKERDIYTFVLLYKNSRAMYNQPLFCRENGTANCNAVPGNCHYFTKYVEIAIESYKVRSNCKTQHSVSFCNKSLHAENRH